MVLKNPRRKGGMVLNKSGRRGPYLLKTDRRVAVHLNPIYD
jgi:hypothetical protein